MNIFEITDGTNIVNLLSENYGWCLNTYNPVIAQLKNGGVFQSSPLSDGRRLVNARFDNVEDVLSLDVKGSGQQETILYTRKALQLLQQAREYWVGHGDMVWIKAKVDCESMPRYAVIVNYSWPDLRFPYGEAFFPDTGVASMWSLDLALEHLIWQDDEPGTSSCIELSAEADFEELVEVCYGEFNGVSTRINCGSDASMDNVTISATGMTIDCWVRTSATPGSTIKICGKFFWWLGMTSSGALSAFISTSGVNPQSTSNETINDGEWHHVAMVYNDNTSRAIQLFIDGVEVTYATQTIGTLIVSNDAVENFAIGDKDDRTGDFWDGDIGWLRFSDDILYSVTFTVPERCKLPITTGDTVGQWIGAECSGATIKNQQGDTNLDGTAVNLTFGECPDDNTFGRSATCLQEVYIANKHNYAQLSHVFWNDISLGNWSTNLLTTSLPHNLLPFPNVAIGDLLYFISDSSLTDEGPFCSIVFDIGAAATGMVGVWEYYNGAWVALTIYQDNTSDFSVTGVTSVHWEQPSDWDKTVTVNGITGFAVRYRVTTAPVPATPPTQQNRRIYSILWPYIDIDELQSIGDIVSLIRGQIENVSSDSSFLIINSDMWSSRIVMGLRSVNRGSNFTAYLNASSLQLPDNITTSRLSPATVTEDADTTTPTGERVTWSPVAPVSMSDLYSIEISEPLTSDFEGKFHIFLRGRQLNGSAGDITIQIQVFITGAAAGAIAEELLVFSSKIKPFETTNDDQLLDFGAVELPGIKFTTGSVVGQYTIVIRGETTSATPDAYFYDIVLVPIDEWAADFSDRNLNSTASILTSGGQMVFDSVSDPKTGLTSINEVISSGFIYSSWQIVSNGEAIIQANKDQRFWFLAQTQNRLSDIEPSSLPEVAHRLSMTGTDRYLGFSG